jgi:hypothetical protein
LVFFLDYFPLIVFLDIVVVGIISPFPQILSLLFLNFGGGNAFPARMGGGVGVSKFTFKFFIVEKFWVKKSTSEVSKGEWLGVENFLLQKWLPFHSFAYLCIS